MCVREMGLICTSVWPYFVLKRILVQVQNFFLAGQMFLHTISSGDHPITASAIAREIGLLGSLDKSESRRHRSSMITFHESQQTEEICLAVVHGEEIAEMTDAQWDEILDRKYVVFARTTPEQKLTIVEQCQKRKEIVAVTGQKGNEKKFILRYGVFIEILSAS